MGKTKERNQIMKAPLTRKEKIKSLVQLAALFDSRVVTEQFGHHLCFEASIKHPVSENCPTYLHLKVNGERQNIAAEGRNPEEAMEALFDLITVPGTFMATQDQRASWNAEYEIWLRHADADWLRHHPVGILEK
jgi:hypothetical protein